MVTRAERAFFTADIAAARALWISRARHESGRIADARELMRGHGYETVDAQSGELLLPDGREVLNAYGHAWALRPDIHAQRLAEAFEHAKQRDAALSNQQPARPSPPRVCASLIDGQLCGGTLVLASVCPRCALGKSGVTATLTCDVCGHVSAIMRGDS